LLHNQKGVSKGAVVALDPATGALLASVSIPGYDPNLLVSHDTAAASAAYNKLNTDANRPLADRALGEINPPGSTFKVITAAAAINNLGLTPDSVIQGGDRYQPPQTSSFFIKNASGVDCPDQIALIQALTVSCNTAFARLAVEQIGADRLKGMAQAFGFEAEPRFVEDGDNLYGVAASHTGPMTGPDGRVDPPALAQSAIGQREVKMSPLQDALVAATIANNGSQMRPYLIDKRQTADLATVDTTQPKEARHPINAQVAGALQQMMFSVVANGTARKAQIPGFQVGGKTGTAENAEEADAHGWFIGFAMKNGRPLVAVAVFLEQAGQGGSAEAARIGGEVMKAYLKEKGMA
jgi:peptidoglycan glycosyltransferase